MRIQFVVLIAIFILLLGSCSTDNEVNYKSHINFKSYKDIPGVTEEEIEAIEELKKHHPEFIYGVNITMEAFLPKTAR
jgi:hypothetical protein